MAKIVQNPAGGIHSVPDDFEIPLTPAGLPVDGWSELTTKDASPALLGTSPDPAVAAVESHDGGTVPPDVPSTDAVGTPVSLPVADPAAPTTDTIVPEGETPAVTE